MLFIQIITKRYDKDHRSGDNMRRINSVRFVDVPDQVMDLSMGEYYLHDNCQRKAKVLPLTDCFKIRERVYVSKKDEDCYIVFYSNRPADQHFKPVMTLNDHQLSAFRRKRQRVGADLGRLPRTAKHPGDHSAGKQSGC